MNQYPIITSVGIEIEIENVSVHKLGNRNLISDNIQFHLTHDASCETNKRVLNGLEVEYDDDLSYLMNMMLRKETFGGELVSSVIDTENNYLGDLKKITKTLLDLGEEPKSFRAGFHIHICLPISLAILKNTMRLARHLEQVFYLLGTAGYEFRGIKNDSIYCRPITKKGPVVVPLSKGFAQVFNITDLLKSNSVIEFKDRYGDLDQLMTRYIPVRYHFINLVPLWTQGSVEFRVFNKTTNPFIMKAWIDFCKGVVEYIVSTSFNDLKDEGFLKENSVFDVDFDSREYIIETYKAFTTKIKLDERSDEILLDILERGDLSSIALPNEFVYSHLGERSMIHWRNSTYKPELIKEFIKNPTFVDVHILDRTNQTLQRRIGREGNENIDITRLNPDWFTLSTNTDEINDQEDDDEEIFNSEEEEE